MRARGPPRERERFPQLAEDIGEDPARFLDHHLVESGPKHTDRTSLRMVTDRIRGIDSIAVARAWLAVERKIERGPRDKIVHFLERRIEWLEEHGERPDELPTEDGPARYHRRDVAVQDDADEELTRYHAECGAEVEDQGGRSWYCPNCDTLTNRVQEEPPQQTVAVDGGEER